ncbi:MAG: phosphatase PAP2 family protein [Homoserinimonas sp.]
MVERQGTQKRTVAIAVVALVVAVGFGAVNAIGYRGDPLAADAGWLALLRAGELTWWHAPSQLLDYIGAGVPALLMASIIAGALLLWRRPWGALYFVAAAVLSTAVVEIIKNTVGRLRPQDALVEAGFGSYPSGHSARAATFAVVLGILVPRLWVWMLGAAYTLAMMFSRTHLGVHWLSDTIGGALTGAAVPLLCFALVARQLEAEGARRHPPPWRRAA